MSPRKTAKMLFRSDDPADLASFLHKKKEGKVAESSATLIKQGLRIMPLNRRIISEADLEFNQFPQILAFWRSKHGPLYGDRAATMFKEFFKTLPKEFSKTLTEKANNFKRAKNAN
jgi:intracellular multiplication protein IcmJ